jgi:hypothetical protein
MNPHDLDAQSLIQEMVDAIRQDDDPPLAPPRERSKELFDMTEILLKIIDEYVAEETLLLSERDAFAREIRYEPKERLNYRLRDRFSHYGLENNSEETIRARVILEKNEELDLVKLNKAILQLKELHKQLVGIAYTARELDRRK